MIHSAGDHMSLSNLIEAVHRPVLLRACHRGKVVDIPHGLKVPAANEEVHPRSIPGPYLFQDLIDLIQLTMATAFDCNLCVYVQARPQQKLYFTPYLHSVPPLNIRNLWNINVTTSMQ